MRVRFSERLFHLEEQWAMRDRFSVVRKRIRGKQYFYAQWYEEGVQRRKGIPHDKVEGMLIRSDQKKKLRQELRQARTQLREMSKQERKDVRAEMKILRILYRTNGKFVGSEKQKQDPSLFDREKPWRTQSPAESFLRGCTSVEHPVNRDLNGEIRDSKSELILTLLMRLLHCEGTYNRPVSTRKAVRIPDFTFERGREMLFWEHMGMLSDEEYRARQKEKLSEYREIGIVTGKNLMITVDHTPSGGGPSCIDLPEVIWRMVRFGLVSARSVMRTIQKARRTSRNRCAMQGI